mgnify:CR=1 FL=1
MSENTEISNPSEIDENIDFVLEANVTTCQNCESEHESGFEFCPHCGQKTEEDLTTNKWDFKKFITEYDLRRSKDFVKTFPELAEFYKNI